MSSETQQKTPVVFSPSLLADDELANYWMRQATLRARREIAWFWQERGLGPPPQPGQLPPMVDKASESLDLSRHWAEKQRFFETDTAAKYLSEELSAPAPQPSKVRRGSFSWVAKELSLDDVSAFALALGLAASLDGSFGAVIGSILNDGARVYPNLMLIQRLWEKPKEVLALADPGHSLFSHGLLHRAPAGPQQYSEVLWSHPLAAPSMVARALLFDEPVTPGGVALLEAADFEPSERTETQNLIACRLKSEPARQLRVVPLQGNRRSPYRQTAMNLARSANLSLWEYSGDPLAFTDRDYLNMLITLCWLQNRALLIGHEVQEGVEKHRERNEGLPLISIPVTVFMPISDRRQISHIQPQLTLPVVKIPALTFEQRLKVWMSEFGEDASRYGNILKEVARRFRYEKETIQQICSELKSLPNKPGEEEFLAACRAEVSMDIGELATYVEPRFADERLILPRKQALQFEEQLAAMKRLTEVHYNWGMARAWNEAGITALFAGPPGTGKTMAAEIMAYRLKLPMYRVDLSQVVNKYIGETEKNLKRIFDAADISDMVLFFDEADALFGKRTDVSDSRDRYANLEISYLLERMERFKGLAILATNRKGDLDEAFLRRLRYVIDFPSPDEAQRAEIWKQVIPPPVAKNSYIDVSFLAREFPLSGGHIRSVVFNACLQSANRDEAVKRLHAKDVIVAVKREYDKMNRSLNSDRLGAYAKEIESLE
jgi:hypothetical protein